jgi:hypothetical protein
MDTMLYTVTGTGLHVGGKDNVVQFGSFLKMGYTYYASNGDFVMSDSGSQGFNWSVFPTGSHNTLTLPGWDSTDANGIHHVHTETRTYESTERITTKGGSFDAIRIRDVTNDVASIPDGSSYSFVTKAYYWVVPSLGFIAKQSVELASTDVSQGETAHERIQYDLELLKASVK